MGWANPIPVRPAWRRPSERLGAEIALAFAAGVTAFFVAALVSAAARSHVPGLLLTIPFVLAVLLVARFAGMIYALPVGVVSVEAFDWYFLPPTRPFAETDAGTASVLGLFIATAVLVGAVADRAARRADASEEARGVLADEQAALRRVATLVAQQPSSEQVFAAVAEEVGRLLGVDVAQLHVFDADGTATVVASWGVRDARMQVGTRLPLEGENLAAVVFRTQRPARIDGSADGTDPTAEYVRSLGVRSAVASPIVVEGRLWGLMTAGSLQVEPLPVGTESRIGAFTELVATAISNEDARSELERVAAQQAALSRVATFVAGGAPPTAVFAAVAAEIAELMGVPHAGLVRYDSDRAATTMATASGPPQAGRSWSLLPDDNSVLATVLRTGRPARIDGYADLEGTTAEAARELGVESGVGVPIIVSGEVWGCLAIGLPKDHLPLAANAVDRLTAFTELVVTAISNAEARAEVTRLVDEQAALRRVATLVARAAPPADVFAAVTEEVGRLLPVDLTALSRYEADGTVTVLAGWREDGDLVGLGTRPMLGGPNVSTLVWQTGCAARMDSYGDDSSGALAALIRETGIRSAVGTPIVVGGRLWGVMIAACTSDDSLPGDTEARLSNFTDLVATAISNAETRAELAASRARIVAAADDSRRRLERDLHDGIQQRLVSLALEVRAAETMTSGPADDLRGQLSRIVDGLSAALDDLREISRGIHPAILSEGGLGPALKALARRSPVPVTLDVNIDSRLAEPVEVAAYYVASEALANAAKHADATVVELQLGLREDALALTIRDNGIGGADPGRGSGLLGLTDRVEALSGTISVVSPPGAGTSVEVELPRAEGGLPASR